jgi:Fe-S-cluster containining protein
LINPNICGQCDSMGRSCCTLRAENNQGLPAPVSEPEIERILSFLKFKEKDAFLDTRTNSPQFISQMEILFPDMADSVHKIFPENGIHFDLKTQQDACIFKAINGCILSDEARPHFCRIYPFWFFDGEPHIFEDSNCLALENCQTISEVLLSIGTNTEKQKQIHALICEDWGLSRSIPQEKKKIYL